MAAGRGRGGVGRGTPFYALHSRLCQKKGYPIFLRLDVYKIVGISQVVGYGREGKLSFWSVKGIQKGWQMHFMAVKKARSLRGLVCERITTGAIHSTKISGNFGPKVNGSVRSNRKSFEKTGPPFEVHHFSRSDRLEFWLNGSRPTWQWKVRKILTWKKRHKKTKNATGRPTGPGAQGAMGHNSMRECRLLWNRLFLLYLSRWGRKTYM